MDEVKILRSKNFLTNFFIPNLFTPEECKLIINSPDTEEPFEARVVKVQTNFEQDVQEKLDKSIRKTKIKFLKKNDNTFWIGNRIFKALMDTNKKFYKQHISYLADLEILEYSEGCFYDWHIDAFQSNEGEIRKFSFVILLSDKNDFEGGDLVFFQEKNQSVLEQGTMIIFPSFYYHKVEPVIKGVRYSLVGWAYGDPYS